MKIKDVISTLERFAPLPLQEDYDNAGLQVGLTEAEVSGVLLCLDVTEQVVSEAQQLGCNMIVSHHPLIFRKLRHISGDSYIERCVMQAIRSGITIVSRHTNLDSAEGGVNYEIARRLGIDMQTVTILQPREVEGVTGGARIVGELPQPLTAEAYINKVKENGYFQYRRNEQSKYWMYETINERLKNSFYHNKEIHQLIQPTENEVLGGQVSSFIAANRLLDKYFDLLKKGYSAQ